MTETITITVPRDAAERLAELWENDARPDHYVPALRDLLAGQDGHLHTLNAALNRSH